MLQITFGEIEAGWAQTWFDTGTVRVEVDMSYLTEPFADLADLVLTMLSGEQEARMQFAEEPGEYRLIATRTGDTYRLRLERWTDIYCIPKEDNKLEEVCLEVSGIEPAAFALHVWSELKRVAVFSAVQEWRMKDDDEDDDLRVLDYQFRDDKISELEKALAN